MWLSNTLLLNVIELVVSQENEVAYYSFYSKYIASCKLKWNLPNYILSLYHIHTKIYNIVLISGIQMVICYFAAYTSL